MERYKVKFLDGSKKIFHPYQIRDILKNIKNNGNLHFQSWSAEKDYIDNIPFLLINIRNITTIDEIKVINWAGLKE